MPSSMISSQSMHLGVPATASHAIATQTIFIVYYKPRTSQFIVGVNKYLEAVNNKFNAGMRFEGDDAPERRFSGTIIGVEDFSPHWKDSKWRSLKVSPWEIEPFVASAPSNLAPTIMPKSKRPRLLAELPGLDLSSTASGPWNSGLTQSTVHGESSRRQEDQVMWNLRQTDVSINSNSISEGGWLSSSPHMPQDIITEEKRNISAWPMTHSTFSMNHPSKITHTSPFDLIEKPTESDAPTVCRLFGIDLVHRPAASTSPVVQPINLSNGATDGYPLNTTTTQSSPTESDKRSDLSKVSEEKRKELFPTSTSRQLSSTSTRSRTKVHMQGVAVGRAVDLPMLEGYKELTDELEKMFDIIGQLHPRDKWEIVYTDDEADIMLVGDDPWPEFCNMVRRIYICLKEDVKKLTPGTKLPIFSVEDETAINSSDSIEN